MIMKDNKSKKSLLIWDKNVPLHLRSQISDVVSDKESLAKLTLNLYDEIFLLAELNWDVYKRADFFGVELIKILRVNHRLVCPIIVCSFMPFSYFIDPLQHETYSHYRVLGTPGHYFIQLPVWFLNQGNYDGIDEQTLEDINLDIFHPLADVKKIMHDLPNDASEIGKNLHNVSEYKLLLSKSVRQEFSKIRQKVINRVKFDELTEDLINNLNSKIAEGDFKSNDVRLIFENYRQLIYGMLPVAISDESNDKNKIIVNPQRWKVLIIDDQEGTCTDLCEMFTERGISCHTSTNGQKALEILKNDLNNENLISVVISDFRLYSDKNNFQWQQLQGYKILSTIFESTTLNSPYAYVMLTSRKGTILEQIKEQAKFRISWFHKADVLSGGTSAFNLFYQRILEIGSEAFLRKHEMPDTSVWVSGNNRVDYGYSFFYKLHIEALDYIEAEEQINRETIQSLDSVLNGKGIDRQIENQISLKFDDKRPDKNQYIDKRTILLDKFRGTVLLARRIIWGLWDLGYDFDQIFHIMNPDYKFIEGDKLDQSKKTFFNTSLGISIKDLSINKVGLFRYSLLVEERTFLKLVAKSFSESQKNGDKLIIDKKNRDILFTYFDYIAECHDLTVKIPQITDIYRKLDYGNVEDSELSKILKKIENLILDNPTLAASFKKATKSFYNYSDYEGLSEKYLNKLLALKYW
jgi:CheY-like chemotaxis protein